MRPQNRPVIFPAFASAGSGVRAVVAPLHKYFISINISCPSASAVPPTNIPRLPRSPCRRARQKRMTGIGVNAATQRHWLRILSAKPLDRKIIVYATAAPVLWCHSPRCRRFLAA